MKLMIFIAAVCFSCSFSMGASFYDKEAGKEVRAIQRASAPIILKMKSKPVRIGAPPKGYEWREPYGKPSRSNDYMRVAYRVRQPKKAPKKR